MTGVPSSRALTRRCGRGAWTWRGRALQPEWAPALVARTGEHWASTLFWWSTPARRSVTPAKNTSIYLPGNLIWLSKEGLFCPAPAQGLEATVIWKLIHPHNWSGWCWWPESHPQPLPGRLLTRLCLGTKGRRSRRDSQGALYRLL